jgi:hypothetical protein
VQKQYGRNSSSVIDILTVGLGASLLLCSLYVINKSGGLIYSKVGAVPAVCRPFYKNSR